MCPRRASISPRSCGIHTIFSLYYFVFSRSYRINSAENREKLPNGLMRFFRLRSFQALSHIFFNRAKTILGQSLAHQGTKDDRVSNENRKRICDESLCKGSKDIRKRVCRSFKVKNGINDEKINKRRALRWLSGF